MLYEELEPHETYEADIKEWMFANRTALLDDGSAPAVFTVRGGKAVRTELKLGYIDGEWVEVRDGLREGDPVVVAGKAALREGSAVQVIGAGAAAAKPAATAQATR